MLSYRFCKSGHYGAETLGNSEDSFKACCLHLVTLQISLPKLHRSALIVHLHCSELPRIAQRISR
jgi:hypothetical protein